MPSATTRISLTAGGKRDFNILIPHNRLTIIKAKGELTLWDSAGNKIEGLKAGAEKDFEQEQFRGQASIQSTLTEEVILFWGQFEKLKMPAPGADVLTPIFSEATLRGFFNTGSGGGINPYLHSPAGYALGVMHQPLSGIIFTPAGPVDSVLAWNHENNSHVPLGADNSISIEATVQPEFNYLTLVLPVAPDNPLTLAVQNIDKARDPAEDIAFQGIWDVAARAYVTTIANAGIFRVNVTGLNVVVITSNQAAPNFPIRWMLTQGGAL